MPRKNEEKKMKPRRGTVALTRDGSKKEGLKENGAADWDRYNTTCQPWPFIVMAGEETAWGSQSSVDNVSVIVLGRQ